MLIDILRMPPVFGIPIDRQLSIYTGQQAPDDVQRPFIHWPHLSLYQNKVKVGSVIDRNPQNLYKSIHVSTDNKWVFETVFSVENQGCICLYTKIISSLETNFAISLEAINAYKVADIPYTSISNFITNFTASFEGQYYLSTTPYSLSIDNILPPVFGEQQLLRHINRLMDQASNGYGNRGIGWMFHPIYEHQPVLLEGLIEGRIRRNPFHELVTHHPLVHITHDKWFNYESLILHIEARGFNAHVNHPAFDLVALAMMSLSPAKVAITCAMAEAIDGIQGLWLTREYRDPYKGLLHGINNDDEQQFLYQQHLTTIFYQCAMIYCRLHHIDSEIFLDKDHEQSSITISKNIHDEISITFHDLMNDRYVCFYTSFPALALTTLAAGCLC